MKVAVLAEKQRQAMVIGVSEKEVSIKPLLPCVREVSLKEAFGYYDESSMVIDFIQQGRIDNSIQAIGCDPLGGDRRSGISQAGRKSRSGEDRRGS
jgi:hypothetical protein